jgi:hypothetical protein
MPRKKPNIRVVENDEIETQEAQEAQEAPVWTVPDLAGIPVDDALNSRSLSRIAEVLTDVERVINELELELSNTKTDLGKRIKVVRSRRADLIHELEELTHTWVSDHVSGVAYLVAVDSVQNMDRAIAAQDHPQIILLAKRTRPLAQDDLQERLFAAEA